MPKRRLKTPLHFEIAKDLKAIRQASGSTGTQVGKLIGKTRDAVSKIERGENSVTIDTYFKIIDGYREHIPGHPAIKLYEYMMKKSPAE